MLLNSISSPQDLHKLKSYDMVRLAEEIRTQIIKTVEETGGHLGANLGVVELTLALHSTLNSPADKIIWDVGHQCYAHKLLTGRLEDFPMLRQQNGLSGFPKGSESKHDCFDVGHSSTSISAAAGLAVARDLQNQTYSVVAVIGDGALTGGMALEALNHVGQLKTNLIVVLNDNAMSIAGNVGALSDYLNRIRLDPTLARARGDLEEFIKRIPAIGQSMTRVASGLKDAVKSLLPGQLFEELGFSYFGPFDGHNISQLQRAIRDGINRKGPVLIHVLTQKGKGYAPAERNPAKYHGVSPRQPKIAADLNRKSFSDVFGYSVVEMAKVDKAVVGITAAMKDATGFAEFAVRYPDRFFDVGIAEQHALTFAAGLAKNGMKPIIALYSTFLQRGYDQVLHDICLQKLPVIIGIDRAGVVGDDGPTHHGVFDISFLRHIPNLTLLAPRNGSELQSMLRFALNHGQPVAIRYPRGSTSVLFDDPIDKDPTSCQVLRKGKDCLILAIGNMVDPALDCANLLQKEIDCGVVNVRAIKPLDRDTISQLASETKEIVTVEDHVLQGGFGSAVLEAVSNIDGVSVVRMGYPDEFIEQGPIDYLHTKYQLTAEGIAKVVREVISQRHQSLIVEGEF